MYQYLLIGLLLIVTICLLLWQIINKYKIRRYPTKHKIHKKYKKHRSKKTKGKTLRETFKSAYNKLLLTMGISHTTTIPLRSRRVITQQDISHGR